MTAKQLVAHLLETVDPYDIDDPLEKPTPEELANEEFAANSAEATRLLAAVATTKALADAADTYLKRQNRTQHPDGEFDQKGRWYPSASEQQRCCDHISSPTRNWPYSYLLHCRTLQHVARLHGVDLKALRHYLRR